MSKDPRDLRDATDWLEAFIADAEGRHRIEDFFDTPAVPPYTGNAPQPSFYAADNGEAHIPAMLDKDWNPIQTS
jgi:hypothetical protein